jgi:hypothetical protein
MAIHAWEIHVIEVLLSSGTGDSELEVERCREGGAICIKGGADSFQ